MADLETRLQRAFAADAPPATDPLFRVQVILRQQRAALRRQLAEGFRYACACSVLTVLVLQVVDEVGESARVRLVVTAILALSYMAIFTRRYLGMPSFVHLMRAWLRSVKATLR